MLYYVWWGGKKLQLDLFQNKLVSKLHPKVSLLKSNSQLISEKNMLLDWTNGLVDRDGKFIKQFQETFHSCFWEILLYKLFTDAGFSLNQSYQVPDYIVTSPCNFYVEAVTANIRQGGRQEIERTLYDQFSVLVPPYRQDDFYERLDEAIVRLANSINVKYNKYCNEYLKREWIKRDVPYVVALASFDQINYGAEYIYPMLALLYGLYFDVHKNSYNFKDHIQKEQTNAQIQLGIFNDEHYSDISAIIYTCTLTLGKLTALSISCGNHSLNKVYNIRENLETKQFILQNVSPFSTEDIGDGIFVFHNPNAKNKLPDNLFENVAITNIQMDNTGVCFFGNECPIVARINTPLLQNDFLLCEIVREYNRLSPSEFYDF